MSSQLVLRWLQWFSVLMMCTTTVFSQLVETGSKITASDPAFYDNFGSSVGLIADKMAVGAKSEDSAGNNAGTVYMFERSGTAWTQTAKITASDPAPYDAFGFSLGLITDKMAVGALSEDSAGNEAGAVYMFERSGNTWTQTAKITASDPAYGTFGSSVGLIADKMAVGAAPLWKAGAVYMFERSGNTWTQTAKITASVPGTRFGSSVGLIADKMAVGAPREDSAGDDAGTVYIFERSGTAWIQLGSKITASDLALYDTFGSSVGLIADKMAVGAPREDSASEDAGTVYMFERSGTAWTQTAKITASNPQIHDLFGFSLGLIADMLAVGAFGGVSNAAAVYTYIPTTAAPTVAPTKLISDVPEGCNQVCFPRSRGDCVWHRTRCTDEAFQKGVPNSYVPSLE